MIDGIETVTVTAIETGEMAGEMRTVMVTRMSEIIAIAEAKTEETMAFEIKIGIAIEQVGIGGMWPLIAICLPVAEMTRREHERENESGIDSVCGDV